MLQAEETHITMIEATQVVRQGQNERRTGRRFLSGGLQARMTFSYVWMTVVFVLMLEILVFSFLLLIANNWLQSLDLATAKRVGIQYAYTASLQSDGLLLNPRSTFLPGTPASLMPQGESVPLEQVQKTFFLENVRVSYHAERLPASAVIVVALLIAPNGEVVASSYPAMYPAHTAISALLPQQAQSITRALQGVSSTYAQQFSTLYAIETVWGRNGHPIGALYLQAPFQAITPFNAFQPLALLLTLTGLLFLLITTPIGGLFGLLTTRGLVRRIQRLVQATTRFADGDYQQRVVVSRKDEVGQLELHFNRMAEQLAESTARQRELSAQNARMAERARIARELHDAISQDLFSLRMLAFGIQDALPEEAQLQSIRTQLATISELANSMIREMRALLLELRPTQLEHLGLPEALQQLAMLYKERLGVAIEIGLSPVTLHARAEHALLRIVQEALSNAVRHGRATTIILSLVAHQHEVMLTITDNGEGFQVEDEQKRHGLGLHLMQERIRELNGTWQIQSAPGQGTTITITVPEE